MPSNLCQGSSYILFQQDQKSSQSRIQLRIRYDLELLPIHYLKKYYRQYLQNLQQR